MNVPQYGAATSLSTSHLSSRVVRSLLKVINKPKMENSRSDSRKNKRNFPGSKIVGYFSIGEGRTFTPGSSKLKYFYPPPHDHCDFDLDEGRDLVPLDDLHKELYGDEYEAENASLMLKWIESNFDKMKAPPGSDRLLASHFVCTHGLLVRLLSAPYQHPKTSWKIWAGKCGGTIYLKRDANYGKRTFEAAVKAISPCYWGHKFQQYVSSELPNQAPDMTKPVVLNEEFRCVHQFASGNFSVLFSSPKKAVVSKQLLTDPIPLDKLKFVDIRTKVISRVTPEHYGKIIRKNQYLKWWAGAHLTNDDKILCAFTDEEGIVKHVKTYSRDELVKESVGHWNPHDCIKSCEDLLSLIAEKVLDDCDKTIYAFTKISGKGIIVTEESPTKENSVVPEWYKKAMRQ